MTNILTVVSFLLAVLSGCVIGYGCHVKKAIKDFSEQIKNSAE